MQPSVAVDRGSVVERFVNNTVAVRGTAVRVIDLRMAVETGRERQRWLLAEVRKGFVEARANVARGRDQLSGWRACGKVVPRTSRPETDRLDAQRRDLHETYAATGDPAIRAQLMESYDGFARSLALKFRHREAVDDLVQVARIGLLHAIDRFDPALGRPFPLFAGITITGELKRHIRDKTWGMRVPRSLQEDYLEVMRAVDELTAEQSDSPSIDALADRCGISVERVLEAQELRVSQRALSIDAPAAPGSDEPVVELGQEETGFGRLENHELLSQLLDRLPERDRRIVELRFVDELTQSEIAAKVGVSQMCVSRVLARTLSRLRSWARTAVS